MPSKPFNIIKITGSRQAVENCFWWPSIIERKDKQRRAEELGKFFAGHKSGHMLALMIAKLEEYLDIFDARDFHDVAISAKSMDAGLVIDVYTEISKRFDYPLHLGVTHAGPRDTGAIRSIAALSTLVANGIGDTLRISYASDHIDEVKDGLELLYCLASMADGLNFGLKGHQSGW